jgi:RiboL-PSP-HEPN
VANFQHPDKISDAIRLVTAIKLWPQVAAALGSDAKSVKAQLTVIVDRRNKIAHEADMDPTNPGIQWPISGALVKNALNFIDHVVQAIYNAAV